MSKANINLENSGGGQMMSQQSKQLDLDLLKAGMIIAKPVLSNRGMVLLDKGAVLTAEKIECLRSWQVSSVSIVTLLNGGTAKIDLAKTYEETLNLTSQIFERVRIYQVVPVAEFKQIVESYISLMIDAVGVVESLYKIKCHSEYTYRHSLNVSILCGLFGKWLGYKDQELHDLILAGLLHDIGKTCICKEILDKPDKLNDQETEVMRMHSQKGYRLLTGTQDIPPAVKLAVLQHHERGDGSGYPLGLANSDISMTGKIVAIADIYDAMTSERVYKKKLPPFAVIETLVEQMYDKLDPELCLTFVSNIRRRLVGAPVQLNNGETGKVLFFSESLGSRPVVQLDTGICVNLDKQRELAISDVLDHELSAL